MTQEREPAANDEVPIQESEPASKDEMKDEKDEEEHHSRLTLSHREAEIIAQNLKESGTRR